MGFTSVLTSLLLGHLLADFPLQTDFIYRLKQKGGIGHIPHVLVHVVVSLILLPALIGRLDLLFLLGLGHLVIDMLKPRWGIQSVSKTFLFDQGLHIVFLVIVASLGDDLASALPIGVLMVLLGLALVPAGLMYISLRKEEGTPTSFSVEKRKTWQYLADMLYNFLVLLPLCLALFEWMAYLLYI